MGEQTEFPFVHAQRYGGPGIGLPGFLQRWCYDNGLEPLFSRTFLDGILKDNHAHVAIICDKFMDAMSASETFCRTLDNYEPLHRCYRHSSHANSYGFYYAGITWKFEFYMNRREHVSGRYFDVILFNIPTGADNLPLYLRK